MSVAEPVAMNSQPDSIVTLGKIAGVFGVQGWVKVFSYTQNREDIFRYCPWFLQRQGVWQEIALLQGQSQGKGLIAHLEGISDRDQAMALNGSLIGVQRDTLPTLADDEFYWSDLIGLRVETINGQSLGIIERLVETGSNDVMIVKGERERWLPWIINDVVQQVSLSEGLVRVDWDPDF
ncbi:MAG: ribosome maturation factor RimM [Thiolinea sp.]